LKTSDYEKMQLYLIQGLLVISDTFFITRWAE